MHKDRFELEGYFKKRKGWDLMKALFAHIRRKLQILNYYYGKELSFDYTTCLDNLKGLDYEKELRRLGKLHENRVVFRKDEVVDYIDIAKQLTNKVLKVVK